MMCPNCHQHMAFYKSWKDSGLTAYECANPDCKEGYTHLGDPPKED